MLLDVIAGRPCEIDVINGAIPPAAREVGLTAPVNEVVTALVRAKAPAPDARQTAPDYRPGMRLGTIGVWCGAFTVAPAAEARPAAARSRRSATTRSGTPEGLGTRESFTNAAVLLAATDRLQVASGIANIWARDAVSAANAARVLSDAFDDRFLLGLGVSHPRQVDPRGHTYRRPSPRCAPSSTPWTTTRSSARTAPA